jgi:signal-transduction protein with cAMP-binding, CBS, and nucleotidyltransferase domain
MAVHVRDVMTSNPTALSAATSVSDAARAMRDREIGDVIVLDELGAVCGIVTDRDIVVRAVAEGLEPGQARLEEICSRELTTIDAAASIDDAVLLMRNKALRRLLVVEDGRPTGIVSFSDIEIRRAPFSTLADIASAPAND